MELNQAQLLVHDDDALERFRHDHGGHGAVLTYLYESVNQHCLDIVRGRHADAKLRAAIRCFRLIGIGNFKLEMMASGLSQCKMEISLIVDMFQGSVASFERGDAVDSNFEVDMPTKAKNLGDVLASKKSKAVATPIVQDLASVQVPPTALSPAPSSVGLSLPSPLSQKNNGKAPVVGSSQKLKWGKKASSVGTSTPSVMLPQDVADLTIEDSVEAGNLMLMQYIQRAKVKSDQLKKHLAKLKKAQKKANYLEGYLNKAKEALAIAKKSRNASDGVVVRFLIEVNAARDKMNKALHDLTELQQVAQG
ncbi:hypothetical protein Acr_00g0005370 [Actinidia rufa]|uniref:Uncharacterized protein n=1 Tax=Actinidia rufa TaxID=165716 RepID=A0A7J0D8C4_9ERIC|nr:hypothetical protein Acr_00g0005370 [Actinidia rufa]